jgi:iron complex transport system ATP-binding protein
VVFTVAEKQLLTDVSGVINGGLVTALIGPNGAGKSTLLRVLAGELEPEAGDVQINNQSMQSLKIRDLAGIRSVMTQGSQIVFEFTGKGGGFIRLVE